MAIKVLVADDHAMVRSGVAQILKGSGITVVGEAANGEEAYDKAIKLKPDIVLMDIRMPKKDGFEALEKIKRKVPNQRVIMLSAFDTQTYVARAVSGGADEFLLKDTVLMAASAALSAMAATREAMTPMEQMHASQPRRVPVA